MLERWSVIQNYLGEGFWRGVASLEKQFGERSVATSLENSKEDSIGKGNSNSVPETPRPLIQAVRFLALTQWDTELDSGDRTASCHNPCSIVRRCAKVLIEDWYHEESGSVVMDKPLI